MSESHFTSLFISISAGLSLFLLGITHLVTQRRHVIIRLLGAATAVLPGTAVLGLIERWDCLPAFAAIVGAALLVHSLWGSSLWTRGTVRVIHLTHQPWLRSALLAVAGPCLALAGIVQFERREDQIADAVLEEMMLIHGVAGNVQVRDAVAITDRGRHIPLGEPIEVRSGRGGGACSPCSTVWAATPISPRAIAPGRILVTMVLMDPRRYTNGLRYMGTTSFRKPSRLCG
ncbi:MAG: hypothetical protein KatS3mg106_414 [Gemmataceae bacterium]|nr:MAG: hypothetical protein KatS3mg106_414 [Gemmataceae bacterium]